MRVIASVLSVLLLAALAGCGESVTVYEPGVYKGEEDPLLAKQASDEHQERLRERFQAVQTDR
ncbi:MAG TPA: hypothetical protein VLT59_01040 [Steroidobacteraceae bacterium]|nr:hypothetical protein [Steroidobacteraceae bacterium]